MKIGVVTFWHGNDNYGMILQCWALQTFLKKLGHDPFVIRYTKNGGWFRRVTKCVYDSLRFLISPNYRNRYIYNQKLQKENIEHNKKRDFEGFRRTYLNFSKNTYNCIESIKLLPPKADCYIAGSDQIWRASLRRNNNMYGYFLKFGSRNTKRIAYAPSFGRVEYPVREIKLLKGALSNFDAISCRESDGVNICKKAGYEAQKVVDPTLLLEVHDYGNIISSSKENSFLFIYSLNIEKPEDIFFEEIKRLYPQKRIVSTPASGFIPGREVFGKDADYKYSTPGEWLSCIKNADLVVTSSFHGIVFSILFHTKFAFIPVKGSFATANNRVLELLQSFDLQYTIINKPADYSLLLEKDFDWDLIDKKKKSLVSNSIEFLVNAINGDK